MRPPSIRSTLLCRPSVVHPRAADDDAGAVADLERQLLRRLAAGDLHRRLQHQVFRRIAAEEELGQHQQVGALALRLGPGEARLLQIAGDVAHHRIELADGDGECGLRVRGHGRDV